MCPHLELVIRSVVVGTVLIGSSLGIASAQPLSHSNPPNARVNQTREVRPDLGPALRQDLSVGENGYKVFQPGSIAQIDTQRVDRDAVSTDRSKGGVGIQATRYGNTDAYIQFGGPGSDHSSRSELSENSIQVDGTLESPQGAVQDDCLDIKSVRTAAYCSTYTTATTGSGTFTGRSRHFFHKSGYIDSELFTWDTTVR